MRHPQLHAALRTAADHAARALAALVDGGDEVPYELLEHAGGTRPTLYSYRPLVGLYLERHAAVLDGLPAVTEAAHTVVAAWGVEAYLEARGVDRPPADAHARACLAIRLFLERALEDAPDFRLRDEHVDAALAELEAVLTVNATETMVAFPLVGIRPEMGTVAITRGVALHRADAIRGEVPDAALTGPDGGPASAVATLRWAARPGSPDTPLRAREAARRLVTALRLHCPAAAPATGPLLWLRGEGGPWRAMALGGTFTARGAADLGPDDVADLRTFVDLVARRLPTRGEVAWALRRWSLALDRDRPEETLSDLLLAGRALLEPEGPAAGRFAGRLAALCAEAADRAALTARLSRLVLQEREVVLGSRRIDRDLPDLVDELADCLRAVLRDCVCGHLRGDLVAVAEEILDGALDDADDARFEERIATHGRWIDRRAQREAPDADAGPDDADGPIRITDARSTEARATDVRPDAPGASGADVVDPGGTTPEPRDDDARSDEAVHHEEDEPATPALGGPRPIIESLAVRGLPDPGDATGGDLYDAERLAATDPSALWLDQTWDEPAVDGTRDDRDDTPWPVALGG
ncbi:MAG: hypothetical protein M0P31_14445 [Solirubrobacteraceae bacterium]|nr:hypothetical protein [Solirubrobacteraceae bacterium]